MIEFGSANASPDAQYCHGEIWLENFGSALLYIYCKLNLISEHLHV